MVLKIQFLLRAYLVSKYETDISDSVSSFWFFSILIISPLDKTMILYQQMDFNPSEEFMNAGLVINKQLLFS